jgi:manganese/zinc/iron transport system substrate-binding protein
MRRRRSRLLPAWIAAALAAATVASGCGVAADAGDGARGSGDVRVTTTTNFITDTAAEIGGQRTTVVPLMGPGVDPHLYRASAGDVDALRDADLILYNGLELEGKMEDVLAELSRRQPAVAVAEGVPEDRLLDAGAGIPGEYDPHIWFDVRLWRHVAETIRDALIEVDPQGRAEYESNAGRYLDELDALDEEVRERLAEIPRERRVLVTSHDAFRYLGRAYDVDVEAIQGISTQAEASTADIERVARMISGRGIRSVFVESSVPRQTIDAVLAAAARRGHQAAVGGELLSDAAGEPGTPEGTYVGMLRHNVDRLVEGLR